MRSRPKPAQWFPPVIETADGEFIITETKCAPVVEFQLSKRQRMGLRGLTTCARRFGPNHLVRPYKDGPVPDPDPEAA